MIATALFITMLLWAGVGLAAPAPGELEAVAERLATAETQKDALAALEKMADPAIEPLLRALKDGALYRLKGRLVMLADDGSVRDIHNAPLPDAALAGNEEPIALDESLFATVNALLGRFAIFSADPAVRKSAALKLGTGNDPNAAAVLAGALEKETDSGVRAALQEALARVQLTAGTPEQRIEAIRRLGREKSEAGLAQLRTVLAAERDPAVQATIRESIKQIETYITLRGLAGYVFNGVSLGAVLLIMSLGLAVTFGLMGIINMAHGEMLMIGSYTAYVVQQLFLSRWPGQQDYYFFVALPLSFVTAGLMGLLLEGAILRFLYGRPLETLIVTWGIGMILQQGARLTFGDQTSVNSPTWFRGGIEALPGLIFPWSRIFIVLLALAVLAALWFALTRTWAGLRVRAVMQNRSMAACVGVSTRRIDALTFALGTAVAGVAGCALALIGTVDPEVGKTYIVDSFMVVVLGGVGKLAGTVIAAFGLGIFNKLLEPSIGGTAAAVYAKVAVLVVVILFLQWRPTGLLASKGRAAAEAASAS
jgi:urea transport system permease protein